MKLKTPQEPIVDRIRHAEYEFLSETLREPNRLVINEKDYRQLCKDCTPLALNMFKKLIGPMEIGQYCGMTVIKSEDVEEPEVYYKPTKKKCKAT